MFCTWAPHQCIFSTTLSFSNSVLYMLCVAACGQSSSLCQQSSVFLTFPAFSLLLLRSLSAQSFDLWADYHRQGCLLHWGRLSSSQSLLFHLSIWLNEGIKVTDTRFQTSVVSQHSPCCPSAIQWIPVKLHGCSPVAQNDLWPLCDGRTDN